MTFQVDCWLTPGINTPRGNPYKVAKWLSKLTVDQPSFPPLPPHLQISTSLQILWVDCRLTPHPLPSLPTYKFQPLCRSSLSWLSIDPPPLPLHLQISTSLQILSKLTVNQPPPKGSTLPEVILAKLHSDFLSGNPCKVTNYDSGEEGGCGCEVCSNSVWFMTLAGHFVWESPCRLRSTYLVYMAISWKLSKLLPWFLGRAAARKTVCLVLLNLL